MGVLIGFGPVPCGYRRDFRCQRGPVNRSIPGIAGDGLGPMIQPPPNGGKGFGVCVSRVTYGPWREVDVGIHAVSQRTIGEPEWGWSGGRYVYVEEADLERARAALEAGRLSEEAGRQYGEP